MKWVGYAPILTMLLAGGVGLREYQQAQEREARAQALAGLRCLEVELFLLRRPEARPQIEGAGGALRRAAREGCVGVDPWGHPYRVRQRRGRLEPFSLGPDGIAGTEHDVRVGPPANSGCAFGGAHVEAFGATVGPIVLGLIGVSADSERIRLPRVGCGADSAR